MAVNQHTRRVLIAALGSTGTAKDLADILDTGSGTLRADTKKRIRVGMANEAAADTFVTSVEAGTSLTRNVQRHLSNMVGDAGVARDIAAQL